MTTQSAERKAQSVRKRTAPSATRSALCGFLLAALCFLPAFSRADESTDLKKDLVIIQAKIETERARYDAAVAQIERARIVFQQLKAAEKALQEKIQKAESSKQQAERKASEKER